VERVDHVHVVQIGGGCLIGHVDRMHERQIPDGECLEFRVARMHAAQVVVIDLAQAGRQLSASRPGARDHHQRLLRLDVRIGSVALGADDSIDFGRVADGRTVSVDGDAAALELVPELDRSRLPVKTSDHDPPQRNTPFAEIVDQLHGIDVVGDAEVGPHLPALDGPGVDAQNNFGLFLELGQEPHLDVGIVARQDSGGMVIEQQLAAELQIQLVAESVHAFQNGCGLFLQILFVVKTDCILHGCLFRGSPRHGKGGQEGPAKVFKAIDHSNMQKAAPGGAREGS
jgi:hypothetical protein